MFEGKVFKLGGTDYVVPALSLEDLRRFAEDGTLAKGQQGTMSVEEIDAQIAILTACLRRNYETVTKEAVAKWVDMTNLHPLLRHVFGISGLEAAPPGASGSP